MKKYILFSAIFLALISCTNYDMVKTDKYASKDSAKLEAQTKKAKESNPNYMAASKPMATIVGISNSQGDFLRVGPIKNYDVEKMGAGYSKAYKPDYNVKSHEVIVNLYAFNLGNKTITSGISSPIAYNLHNNFVYDLNNGKLNYKFGDVKVMKDAIVKVSYMGNVVDYTLVTFEAEKDGQRHVYQVYQTVFNDTIVKVKFDFTGIYVEDTFYRNEMDYYGIRFIKTLSLRALYDTNRINEETYMDLNKDHSKVYEEFDATEVINSLKWEKSEFSKVK